MERVSLVDPGHEYRLRLRNANVLFAFLVVMSMWAFHDMFWVRMGPRYLAFMVRVRVWQCME